jgi:hypothetical protein
MRAPPPGRARVSRPGTKPYTHTRRIHAHLPLLLARAFTQQIATRRRSSSSSSIPGTDGAPLSSMADVVLIVTIVIFSLLVILGAVYFLAYFQHPEDRNTAWFPKIVVVGRGRGRGFM